jgi:TonB-linked SusC/RagA family outer membrane protein
MPREFACAVGLLLCVLAPHPTAQAQTHPITGRVLAAGTREPVPYGTVSVVGGGQAVQASARGEFRIVVPIAPVTLSARSIGYKRGEVRVGPADSTAEFVLEQDVLGLEAVVVTGQATTLENRNAATYVPTVGREKLTAVPALSPEQALQGKVPGARINMNSGAPGGGGQIQIRGVTTVLGNGEPLYVVDGVIISNAQVQSGTNTITNAGGRGNIATNQDNGTNRLADLNPADIETIQVLEGAAASAIYGSRATNGVILITTRRGQAGAPRFDVTQRIGVYDVTRLPGGRRFPNEAAAISAARAAGVDSAHARQLVDSLYALNPNPFYDYQTELYGNRDPSYETAVSGRGGTDDARFFLSAGTKRDEGTLLNTGARRDALRLNADFHPGSRVTVEVGASIVHSTADRGLSNNDNSYTSPLYAFGYTPAIIDLNHADAQGNFPENPFPAGGGHSASNPFQTLAYLTNHEDVWRQIGSATLKWQAVTGTAGRLELSAVGGVDRFNQDNQVYSPNFLQYEGADGFSGRAVQGNANSRQMNSSLNAVWTFSPASGAFTATTSTGAQYEEQDQNVYRLQARGIIPGVPIVSQGTQASFQQRTLIRDQALYGQEQLLAFGERLLVSAGFRADRSSANGDRNRWFVYPKGAASYRLLAPVRAVDELKLRAAVGQSGNRPQYGFRDTTLLDIGRIGGIEGIGVPGTIGNPRVEPERMTEQEYGLDATLLGQRLAVEATYFDRTITKLLLQAPLAPTSGFAQQIINGGELRSEGWELALTANPLRGWRGLNDVFRTTFYTVDQRVVSLPVPNFVVPSSGFGTAFGRSRIAAGASTTAIWGNAPVGPGGAVVDTIVGDATPDFEMQFSNELTWKALVFSVLVDWRKGGDVSDLTNNLFDEGQNSRDYDAPSPDPSVGATLGAYRYNKWNGGRDARVYVQDGSFVKLREVSLACTLPAAWVSHLFGSTVQSARVTVSGRNVVTWSRYWGPDPEVSNFGNQNVSRFVDLAPYPPNRGLFFSLDMGF